MRSEKKKRGVKRGEHLPCQLALLSGQVKAASLLSWCQACLLPPALVRLAWPRHCCGYADAWSSFLPRPSPLG